MEGAPSVSPLPAPAGHGRGRLVKAPAIRYLVKFHSRLFCRRAGGGCWGKGGGGVFVRASLSPVTKFLLFYKLLQ